MFRALGSHARGQAFVRGGLAFMLACGGDGASGPSMMVSDVQPDRGVEAGGVDAVGGATEFPASGEEGLGPLPLSPSLPVAPSASAEGDSPGDGPAPVPTEGGFYRVERLDRGLVAVVTGGGVYVGWRMHGFEYSRENPENILYRLYRDGAAVADVTDSTNFLDPEGTPSSVYSVRPVIGGVEGGMSESATAWPEQFLRVPLQVPPAGTAPTSCPNAGEAYTYAANDGSPGDLDGDGTFEIVLKWDPSNSKDNSQDGCTGNVFIDAYEVDGTLLWRLDLGQNIRAGAHYTQFVVADLDGDGRAEVALKTAPGTKDGTGTALRLGPAASDDDGLALRNDTGRVLEGPEYLSVFDGLTGAEVATVPFDQERGAVSSWGDNYGNRVDRFLASAAYLDGTGLPSVVMARGYYTRTTLTAWNWRGGELARLWKFDSNVTPNDGAGHAYTGQGSHSLVVANVDDDPGQEILYGAMAVDDTGAPLCSTGYGHGDAIHAGDLLPERPGLEFFMCNEDGEHPSYHLRDARTCAIIQEGTITGGDTGRCVADDVDAASPGAEMWASSTNRRLLSARTNAEVGAAPGSTNFLVYWDADESRETEDANHIDKYVGGQTRRLLTADGTSANNGTKSTPTLTADLLGDWREEVVWRETDSAALRIYTTVDLTARRVFTLMHDPQYRMQVSSEQTGYNQPPHPGFYLGAGMEPPPVPSIRVQ